MMKQILACLSLAAVLLLAMPAAVAQSIFANLTGTVTDTSGAVVPGAKVTKLRATTAPSAGCVFVKSPRIPPG